MIEKLTLPPSDPGRTYYDTHPEVIAAKLNEVIEVVNQMQANPSETAEPANQLTAARPQWQIVEGVLEQLATEKTPGASG